MGSEKITEPCDEDEEQDDPKQAENRLFDVVNVHRVA
jgi:hypothetical protein